MEYFMTVSCENGNENPISAIQLSKHSQEAAMRIPKWLTVLTIIFSTIWTVNGMAVEPAATNPDKPCLQLIAIDGINIIDNRHLGFRLRNGDYYLNQLPQSCPWLVRNRAIMYSTPITRLCSRDIIYVLDNVGGGFQQMGSCGLGTFRSVSAEEIQMLKDQASSR
jgi:hypothetical protein